MYIPGVHALQSFKHLAMLDQSASKISISSINILKRFLLPFRVQSYLFKMIQRNIVRIYEHGNEVLFILFRTSLILDRNDSDIVSRLFHSQARVLLGY